MKGVRFRREKLGSFNDKTLELTYVPNGGMIGIKMVKNDRIKVKLSPIFLSHLLLIPNMFRQTLVSFRINIDGERGIKYDHT